MTEDFYDLLDVPADASQEEIKTAFREQVRIYHPDLNDDERAQAQFTALKTAYDVLGDPVERRAYDRLGHRDYVAKRTSGLPSPDKWMTDDATESPDAPGESSVDTETDSWGASASSAHASARGTGSAAASGPSAGGATADGSNVQSSRTTRSGSVSRGSVTGLRRRISRWWRSLNVAGPLLWFATALYVLGIARYGLANGDAVASLWNGIRGAGTAPGAIWSTLTAGTHGIASGFSHVSAAQPVSPPVAGPLWYGLLGGLIVVVIGLLGAWRIRTRGRLRGPVTIDETIVLALALGSTSGLVGGALLTGALLLPLLYGVVIYHSRRIPGWSPSYLYLVAVATPVAGLLAGAFDYTTVPLELLVFVVLPLVGALGLPIRFLIRRRFGI